LKGEEVVYPEQSFIDLSALKPGKINHQGFKFIEFNGDRFFVTYAPSYYTDWTYLIVTPYNSLFQAILSVQKAVLIVFGGLFLLSTEIPLFKNWLDKLKSKDKKNRIEKVEQKVDEKEEQLSEKIILSDEESTSK